jgi:hypothetical protein
MRNQVEKLTFTTLALLFGFGVDAFAQECGGGEVVIIHTTDGAGAHLLGDTMGQRGDDGVVDIGNGLFVSVEGQKLCVIGPVGQEGAERYILLPIDDGPNDPKPHSWEKDIPIISGKRGEDLMVGEDPDSFVLKPKVITAGHQGGTEHRFLLQILVPDPLRIQIIGQQHLERAGAFEIEAEHGGHARSR